MQWDLQVLRDGQQIDSFSGTTNVGQAKTDTHHQVVKNNVGCADKPAGDIDLQRTLTVSPIHANADDVTLQIDAQETLQENAPTTTSAGCKVPPQPRQVTATHPGLVVEAGRVVDVANRRQEPDACLQGPGDVVAGDGRAIALNV